MSPKQETILESGTGLFSTHVQLEDVQEVLQEQMNTKSRLGSGTKYSVIGDGNGFMSRVILVEADWTIPEDHLPNKFILKITSALHAHAIVDKLNASTGNCISKELQEEFWTVFEQEASQQHNREVNLYKIMDKWNQHELMLSPKVYFSKKFDSNNKAKGFLAMEYVEETTVRHIYVNAKPYELHPILKYLAHFQAGSLQFSDEERESIEGFNYKKLREKLMNLNTMKGYYYQARNINKERLTEKFATLESFGMEVVNYELAANTNKYVGIERPVLVHGDLWAANILWKQNGDGQGLSVSKVIDYQLIHMGNPAEDLVRLFLSTLSGADRQQHWERLLELFYEYFLDALEDQEVPYTLEQLKESYKHYFVTGGLIMIPLYGPICEMKLAMSKPEEAGIYRELLTEKAETLLDDMERWHLYSRNTTKQA